MHIVGRRGESACPSAQRQEPLALLSKLHLSFLPELQHNRVLAPLNPSSGCSSAHQPSLMAQNQPKPLLHELLRLLGLPLSFLVCTHTAQSWHFHPVRWVIQAAAFGLLNLFCWNCISCRSDRPSRRIPSCFFPCTHLIEIHP